MISIQALYLKYHTQEELIFGKKAYKKMLNLGN